MYLPAPRGPISDHLRVLLTSPAPVRPGLLSAALADTADPLSDDDLQLALWICYELAYRGFADVPDSAEWDERMLAVRCRLEEAFLTRLRAAVTVPDGAEPSNPRGISARLGELVAADSGPSLSRRLERTGTLTEFTEFVVHRSVYHLKEADPHSWGIPRLAGQAKAALVAVQADEYGAGLASRMHSELFRGTMRWLGLDDTYGRYVDDVPGVTLAISNLISLFGLHRSLRGALAGHLAAFEMTSSLPNRRYSRGLKRLGGDETARRFYEVHVTADALHEQLASVDLCGGLVRDEPELAGDVLFGAACALYMDAIWAGHLIDCWDAGRTSLRVTGDLGARAGSAS